jgi:hypothetical protein
MHHLYNVIELVSISSGPDDFVDLKYSTGCGRNNSHISTGDYKQMV